MKYLQWCVIAALLIVVATMMTCCTRVVPYTAVVYGNIGTDQGRTDCDANGEPIVYLNEDSTKIQSVKYTRIHEAEHVRRVRAFRGGCKAFMHRYQTDIVFALDEEAYAYCAEARAMMWDGKSGAVTIQLITLWLKAHPAGKPFSLDTVEAHVPCRYLADSTRTLIGRLP